MDIKQLKNIAAERVATARFDAKKLALIFTGATVLLSFVISLVSFLLSRQMESAMGLGGLGTRTILSAAQILIMLAGAVASPFWNLGYTRAALDTARDGSAEPKTLLAGFSRFFPAVRLLLLRGLLMIAAALGSVQVGTILYMLTPVSMVAMDRIETLLAGGEAALADPAAIEQLADVFWPMYLLIGIVLLVVLIPMLYRLRLVEFSLMDGREKALKNMLESNFLMRGKCLWMFKLDLSFWWYFLLQALAAAVSYGDLLFNGSDAAYWIFYIFSAGAQLALGWQFLPRVQTAYALAYDEITKTGQA